MLNNQLLDMKDKTQKQLIAAAGYDVKKYMENLSAISRKVENKHGFIFQYTDMKNRKPTTVSC